jgi:hypothetical protein
MHFVHVANTHFEWELVQKKTPPLRASILRHPFFTQLQFLPLLYAQSQEGVAVTHLPSGAFLEGLATKGFALPVLHLLLEHNFPRETAVNSWGASLSVSQWATERRLSYYMPPIDVVRAVNSKQFSFENSPSLPQSRLVWNEKEALEWTCQTPGPLVLKTCFGFSGKGHLLIPVEMKNDATRICLFLKQQQIGGLPLIAEPWVERLLDFSTQWEISKQREINYVGATLCRNDKRGSYLATEVGDEQRLFGANLPYLFEHQSCARPLLVKMADLGYFGNVGIDAFIYRWEDKVMLQPIVEVNARKTMGWVALMVQKKIKKEHLSFSFASTFEKRESLLPTEIVESGGKVIAFKRRLIVDELANNRSGKEN